MGAGHPLIFLMFLLIGSDRDKVGKSTPHYQQQTDYSCGAACLSMLLDLPEAECRKLAHTTRTGTHISNIAGALIRAGRKVHSIHLYAPLEQHLPELTVQSMSWPLILSLEFKHEGRDRIGRKRGYARHHAVVLSGGKFLDPAEWHELDPEAIGHLHQRGVTIKQYLLVE